MQSNNIRLYNIILIFWNVPFCTMLMSTCLFFNSILMPILSLRLRMCILYIYVRSLEISVNLHGNKGRRYDAKGVTVKMVKTSGQYFVIFVKLPFILLLYLLAFFHGHWFRLLSVKLSLASSRLSACIYPPCGVVVVSWKWWAFLRVRSVDAENIFSSVTKSSPDVSPYACGGHASL